MSIRKRFHREWIFECPDAVLTCSILKGPEKPMLVFGGHDKSLYLMDLDVNIIDEISFDGWCRCTFCIDLTGDGYDEVLVGSGDGSFLVLRFNPDKYMLENIMHYKSETKVICCTAGDLYRDGNNELFFGNEDKTLRMFKSVESIKPELTLYYDSWIMSVCLGFLKRPEVPEQVYGLAIGTKNGIIQLIQVINKDIDVIWQKNLFSQINDIKIGDVNHDGYNEIVVCTNDSYVKILDSSGKKLKFITIEGSRPVSVLIEDIDGDNANEIIVGCADGSLRIFHNITVNSFDYKLKWKAKMRSSIKDMSTFVEKEKNISHIIFGGYDRTIRNIYDFEWGKKPKINIRKKKLPTNQVNVNLNAANKIHEIIPTNLKGHVIQILSDKMILSSLDPLKVDLIELGYSAQEVDKQLEILENQKILIYDKIEKPVWSLNQEIIESMQFNKNDIKKNDFVKIDDPNEIHAYNEQKDLEDGEIINKSDHDLKEIIVEYLEKKGFVSSKPIFVNDIVKLGFSVEVVEEKINLMKENGTIQYSRGNPRGWSLKNT